ncbi:Ig-like domain-containing protein, partial [Crocosphaera sp. Alani8]|uniref:Ig-like domain-containing protein n=1 Tax=Crocosphaera sp. Alani8 TaxID=3038952 RepID=UPI00313A92E8
DGQGGTDNATATITIEGVTENTPPVAVDDTETTSETAAVDGNVLDNDSDPNGDDLTVTEVNGEAGDVGTEITLTSGALLTLNSDGSYNYDPNGVFDNLEEGQSDTDSFEYTVSDGQGGTDNATATITIEGVTENTPPVAVDDTETTSETAAVDGNVLDNDSDPNGDDLTVTEVNGEAGDVGTEITLTSGALLTLNSDGSYNYDPNGVFDNLEEGQSDTDSFEYTVSDGQGGTDNATATITIEGVTENTPPVAVDDTETTSETAAVNGDVLENDTDVDEDDLTVTEVNGEAGDVGTEITLASGALLTLNSDGSYNYDPNGVFDNLEEGQSDTDSFEYTVSDGQGGTDNATATITIEGVTENTPPVAVDDTETTSETAAVNGDVLENDTDVDEDDLTVTEVNGEAGDVGTEITLASGALLTLNSDGSYNYDPNGVFDNLEEGQSDTDSFEYTVSDGQGGTDNATATITIEGVTPETPPVANDNSFNTEENTTVTGNVLDNDTDANNDPLTAILDEEPSNGTLEFNEDGSFSYSPDEGFLGTDTFTYQANDGTEDSEIATVSIEVTEAPFVEEMVSFGSTGDDTLDPATIPDFNGIDDFLFAGAGNDLVETTSAIGGNRIYGQSGNDTFFLGDDNRAFGGNGDDIFYLVGDRNIITGGAGSDQFWLALAELPLDVDTITDFELDVDTIGIGGLGLSFDDLTLTQQGSNTLVSGNGDELGLLLNVNSSQLDESDFIFG